MPYAKKRKESDLNRAYAHVSRASWPNAVKQLHDRLVDMGFEDTEADAFIEKTGDLELIGGSIGSLFDKVPPPTVIDLPDDLTALELTMEEQSAVKIEKTDQGTRVTLSGQVSEDVIAKLSEAVKSDEGRQNLQAEAKRHKAVWQLYSSPAERKVPFALPQLSFTFEGERELAEQEAFLGLGGWNLLDYPAELSETDFKLTESGVEWEIDLNRAGKITEKTVGKAEQYNLDLIDTGWTDEQLCRWLEGKVRQPDLTQPVVLEYVRRTMAHLEKRRLPLTALARWKFVLSKVLVQKISQHRGQASKDRYQQFLFAPDAKVEASFDFSFDFAAVPYAPHWSYVGHPYQFQKHYYAAIGELKNQGEEYECAKALDMNAKVKHWARNLDKRGFWLPLAQRKFYPDFVAELIDGRFLALEHKGEIYATNDDSKEKLNIGGLWEETSGGKALFLMTVVEKGKPGLSEQIAAKVG
jgi:type III restriction enzyme